MASHELFCFVRLCLLYTHEGGHTHSNYWLSIATVVHGIALHCIIRRKTGPGGFN